MKDHLANSSLNEKIEFFKTEFKKSLSKQDVSSLNKLLLIRDLAIINGFNFDKDSIMGSYITSGA